MQLVILFCLIAGAFASFECPANSKFNNCGSACPLTCDNYQNPPKACVLMCVPGCHCNEGYVKTKDGRCVEPENCPSAAFDTSSCLMKPDPGMCRAYFPMFYYDAKTGACEELIYGGCQGNDNRFATEAECLGKCGGVRVRESGSEVCGLPLETGVCNALFHRYGFNKKTGKCEKFVYGGCGGNGNRFESLAECESTCSSKQASSEYDCDQFPESGNCRANIMRFWYDQDDGKCKKFTYGGCGGNRNNFATEQDCYKKCVGARAPQSCQEEKAVGSCFGAFPRYFYNKVTGQCELFTYGGCEGNSNNFNTIEDCEAVCL